MVAASDSSSGIGGVDAADQRLGDALERLAAEPAAHEGAEALVGARRRAAARGRAPCAACPASEKSAEASERPSARRRQQQEALGQRMEAAAADHEGAAEAVVGPHQPIVDAEPPAERERPRLLGEERVGAALDEEAVAALGRDGAAEPVARLEQREVERQAALARSSTARCAAARPAMPPPTTTSLAAGLSSGERGVTGRRPIAS